MYTWDRDVDQHAVVIAWEAVVIGWEAGHAVVIRFRAGYAVAKWMWLGI